MKKGLVSALSAMAGALAGAGVTARFTVKEIYKNQNMSDKHLALFLMMNQWVRVKQEGKSLASYFKKNGYKKIAIYGMSYAGETLLEELKGTDIQVAYAIDKNADSIYAEMDIVPLDGALEKVDAIVVTAITFFDEIEDILKEKADCPVISLEDVLDLT